MNEQHYENYWSITNAFTNYNSEKFIESLKISLEFIDAFSEQVYSEEKYLKLQERMNFDSINFISVRKRINQLVKLGFIEPHLTSYHKDSMAYVHAKTNKKRSTLLSKIVYTNSKLNASVDKQSTLHQINFLLKTLEEAGKLHKNDVIGLMNVKIEHVEKGYLTPLELSKVSLKVQDTHFEDRKYNQISHFWNLLKKLDDLVILNDELYFIDDAKVVFGESLKQDRRTRDSYLHRLYKNQLKEESDEKLGQVQCMLEKLSYPSLVASHIKPFIDSGENEAYDANNGLLLSRNMDILFDQGYISFQNDGKLLYSDVLHKDVKISLDAYTLDTLFLNKERIQYFDYHRKNVFRGVL